MTPLLLLIFRAAPNAAVGTDLLFAFGTKMAGAGAHHQQAQVRWDIVRTLSSWSLPEVLTGLGVLVLREEHSTTAQKLMTIAVTAMVASTGILTLLGERTTQRGVRDEASALSARQVHTWTVVAGFGIGVMVAPRLQEIERNV